MRLLLLGLLLAPLASAASAYADGAELGEREARVPLRVEGAVGVVADGPIEVALAPPGSPPEAWASAPADLAPRAGAWRGLEGVTLLWLRRASPETVVVEVTDATREGIVLEWPAKRDAPGPHALAAVLALALVTGCGRGCLPRARCRGGRS